MKEPFLTAVASLSCAEAGGESSLASRQPMLDLADLTFLLHFDREMRSFYCSDGKSDGDEESIKQRALGNNDVGSVYHGEQREKPKQQRTTTPIAERFVARQNLRRKHNREMIVLLARVSGSCHSVVLHGL